MPRTWSLAAGTVLVAGTALAGCSSASPGQTAAQEACRAYADTGRNQGGTTAEAIEAIRDTARSEARRAAGADLRWQVLQRDIEDSYSRENTLSQQSPDDEMDAYFAADRQVQADCASAGEDIGPLRP